MPMRGRLKAKPRKLPTYARQRMRLLLDVFFRKKRFKRMSQKKRPAPVRDWPFGVRIDYDLVQQVGTGDLDIGLLAEFGHEGVQHLVFIIL